ncbi:MAG: STT3 domain-containing protein [Candidatus Micrarchaeaceae archaeon]|jgi:asparagine N-glycosylation enzyme membrane subunit Stt3
MKVDKYYGSAGNESSKDREEHYVEEHKGSKFGSKLDNALDYVEKNRFVVLAIAALIIVIAIWLRTGLLQFQGLFEPDGFFYYSVIRAEINSHHIVNYLGISGFPSHNFIGEAPGLPYITVIFYYLLNGFGISALAIMRWMPILFGVIYTILAYFLAKELSNSRSLGLLAMAMVALSSGNIARTAGTVYRGDTFVSFFIMVALIFMILSFKAKRASLKKYIYAIVSVIALGTGIVIWNGSPFVIIVYMMALALAIAYGFVFADKEVLYSSLVLSLALVLTFAVQRLYIALGWARAYLPLSNASFFVLYIPILLASIATYFLNSMREKSALIGRSIYRIAILAAVAFVAFILVYGLFGNFINSIASPITGPPISATAAANQSNSTKQAIQQTTQELQPPSWGFLVSSFNLQLFLAPIGIALFAIIAILIYNKDSLIKKEHFNISIIAFIVLFSYLAITAYLQSAAIRFNALVSVPIAIFAAFAVYALAKLIYNLQSRNRLLIFIVLAIVAIILIVMVWNIWSYMQSQFIAVVAAVILIIAALAVALIYSAYALITKRLKFRYIALALVLVLLLFSFYNTYFESFTAAQADGINPQFLTAMTWLKSNSNANATVLALWPDGSVVEAWANRTSYMDSVGGENSTRILPFAQWLFNTSYDTQYLYSINKPEYLITRNFWYDELGGIAQEGLVQNASAYGYIILNSLNSTSNGTSRFFIFSSTTPPYYKSELVITGQPNSTTKYAAYLGTANGTRLVLMKNVVFFNSSNAAYNIVNSSSSENSINFSLMVSFDGSEINGAYILGPKLFTSNLFQFTFLCNSFECPYNRNGNVTFTNVYSNGDTRIYKINYNK